MKLSSRKSQVLAAVVTVILTVLVFSITAYASSSTNVSNAVNNAFNSYMKPQIKDVVNKTILPAIDAVLAVFFIIKIVTAGVNFHRNGGQFEWHVPAILFAGLIVSLTAPLWMWTMIGW